MSANTDRMLKNAQANLITIQAAKIAELEAALAIAFERIRKLEKPKPNETVKKEASC